jgi:hypothetical protein
MLKPIHLLAALLPLLLAAPASAEPCEDCFAVFVMPDIQNYTQTIWQPAGAAHLDLTTRWICENRTYVEPDTGKEMPVVMVLQLGDLVQTGDWDEDGDGVLEEWARSDAAFDNLDACAGGPVPYLVVAGNHDVQPRNKYESKADGFNTYFGTSRWGPYQCVDPLACDGSSTWFIGGGSPIPAGARNAMDGPAGPPTSQPGRHRVGIARLPNGGRMLFLGLDLAFDFPPPGSPGEQDDLAWLRSVLAAYPGVPAVVFHHALIGPTGTFVPDGAASFQSDSYTNTEDVWNQIVAPYEQIMMTWNGHWTAYYDEEGQIHRPKENDAVLPNAAGKDVFTFFRNYQGLEHKNGAGVRCPNEKTGSGWNVMAVFDPAAQQIRVQSIRIEDTDDDCTHDGTPAPPAALDREYAGPVAPIPWSFPDTLPASLDNCPDDPNPDQADADSDGVGNVCDPPCSDGLDNDADGMTDTPADVGCRDAAWPSESPPCQDGINNDPAQDALIDWDGGGSAGLPRHLQTQPDPQCSVAWGEREISPPACGLGGELVLLLVPAWRMAVRRNRG